MPLGDGMGPEWAKNHRAAKGNGHGHGRCNGRGRRRQDGTGRHLGEREFGSLSESQSLKIEELSQELADLKAQLAARVNEEAEQGTDSVS